jgi:hypothetical protein
MENRMDDVRQSVGENFEDIRSQLSERTQEIRETIGNYVDANPLAAVGIAFGVGYLLSGALFSRTTFRAASIGTRFALGGLLRQLAPVLLTAVLTGERGGEAQAQPQTERAGGNGNTNRT